MKPYFQAHSMIILTDSPLRQVLHKPEKSGRLMTWAIELGEYDLTYQPRTAVKGQALADFVTEFTWEEAETEKGLDGGKETNRSVFRDSEETARTSFEAEKRLSQAKLGAE